MTYNEPKQNSAPLKLVPGEAGKKMASNPETSPELLDKLADHEQAKIQERVAENPSTSPETLDKLAKHESPEVRSAVADNENTPVEILEALSEDEHPDVRLRMAENPNTPTHVLEALTDDENPFVNTKAQSSLDAMKSVSQKADEMLVQDRFAEAEQLYLELTFGLEVLLGSGNKELAQALHKLAAALIGQGKTEEASVAEKRAQVIEGAHL